MPRRAKTPTRRIDEQPLQARSQPPAPPLPTTQEPSGWPPMMVRPMMLRWTLSPLPPAAIQRPTTDPISSAAPATTMSQMTRRPTVMKSLDAIRRESGPHRRHGWRAARPLEVPTTRHRLTSSLVARANPARAS